MVRLCQFLGTGHVVKIEIHLYTLPIHAASTLEVRIHIHNIYPPIYSASTLEVRIHIYLIQIHPENGSTLTLGVNCKNIPTIHFIPC
jgi:hypothetical protein